MLELLLKFSEANAKLKELLNVLELERWLPKGYKVFSFSLPAGWSCPQANECFSRVVQDAQGKRTIEDGPEMRFRCFAASDEVKYPNTYNQRKHNFDLLKGLSQNEMVELIQASLPPKCGVMRIHVSGDFFNKNYFAAWKQIAADNPKTLFYAYTKSIGLWVNDAELPENFVLTASVGGKQDDLIQLHGLRNVTVVNHPSETDLEIDHSDEHAAVPEWKNNSFALLIHGTQAKGSEASEAIKRLKKEKVKFSYSK